MRLQLRADVIVAFSFGSPDTLHPNRLIAVAAKSRARDYRLPIFTQRDIPILDVQPHGDFQIYFAEEFLTDKERERNISTYKVVVALKRCIEEKDKDWRDVLLEAAPPQAPRCKRDLEKEGFGVAEDDVFSTTSSSVWFDRASRHLWTKSPYLWRPREAILRYLPWPLYKRLSWVI